MSGYHSSCSQMRTSEDGWPRGPPPPRGSVPEATLPSGTPHARPDFRAVARNPHGQREARTTAPQATPGVGSPPITRWRPRGRRPRRPLGVPGGGDTPTHLCLLYFPLPRAHCPPHPRSDCSVLRLPFAVLFCKGGRGHGRGG